MPALSDTHTEAPIAVVRGFCDTDTLKLHTTNPFPEQSVHLMQVQTRDYDGKLCITVAGHALSGVAIAIIVVVVLLAVIALLSFVACCCCCRR